jgi:plasmid stabilization system protein ParE
LAALKYSRRATADLERFATFLEGESDDVVQAAINAITEAIELLVRHPFIGRPVEQGLRELVISHGKTGYVALYDYYARDKLVVILAIRHQREAGY